MSEIEKSCEFCWREKFLVDNNRRLDATRYGASKAMFANAETLIGWLSGLQGKYITGAQTWARMM
jgi:hypothetical protein